MLNVHVYRDVILYVSSFKLNKLDVDYQESHCYFQAKNVILKLNLIFNLWLAKKVKKTELRFRRQKQNTGISLAYSKFR